MKQVIVALVLATALSGCYVGIRSPIYGGFDPPVVVERGHQSCQGLLDRILRHRHTIRTCLMGPMDIGVAGCTADTIIGEATTAVDVTGDRSW